MQTVTVIATKDFTTDDGRVVHSGEAVMLTPIEAAVRGRANQVSLDPRARATYNTRDMNAVPVAAGPEASSTPAAEPYKSSRRRRRRNRVIETS